ncbi:MAG: FtsK/SpoIIIE domain-containing protein [Sedimentisphaerales bacterium]|nr:FtsK/SpoIIIE domain-containing protein [Sedimentisphaerales bacterium]
MMASSGPQALLNAYLTEPPEQTDLAAMQWVALEELLRLTAGSVGPLLEWIGQHYSSGKDDLLDRLQVQISELDRQFGPLIGQTRQVYQARFQELQAELGRRVALLEERLRGVQKRLQERSDHHKAIADQRHADRVMEADFLIEGALERARQRQRQVQQAFQKVKRDLDLIRSQAEGVLTGLSLQMAQWPQIDKADMPPGARPAGLYHRSMAQVHELLRRLRRPWYLRAISTKARRYRLAEQARSLMQAWSSANAALNGRYRQCVELIQTRYGRMIESAKASRRRADQAHKHALSQIKQDLEEALTDLHGRHQQAMAALNSQYEQAKQDLQARMDQELGRLAEQYKQQVDQIQAEHSKLMAELESQYRQRIQAVYARWGKAAERISSYKQSLEAQDPRAVDPLEEVCKKGWQQGSQMPKVIRLGTWHMDRSVLSDQVVQYLRDRSPTTELAAILRIPGGCSVFVEHDRDGRGQAIDLLRALMVRLFLACPPGMVRLTLVDPIGLGQSFAGFMHASDYHQALVGGRIWTEAMEIQRQLEDITNHMENVIQKYLRNEFDTIEQYNSQAGQLAEPYRFLVIADFPSQINEDSARRLSSIVHSGPRCGVHTLIVWDRRYQPPESLDIKDLAASSLHLVFNEGRFLCQRPLPDRLVLIPDLPPSEQALTSIMRAVGKASLDASRVEVPFDGIAPTEQQIWSLDSTDGLTVPIGQTGATSIQYLRLGQGLSQHMLIAGKTGSGKSTLMHVIITSLALWYGPDQVELYLIDFKKGVEFKTYVTHTLPHARAIAVESDREFGLSILQRLLGEMDARGELFRQAGQQDIAAYRLATGKTLARVVLIVDEFQVFFAEDDKLAQDAALALEQLVRQGRAFGIHVILGSQTLGGAFGLARSTMGQMAVRIALQCSEADSQLILDDENVAARRLSRPGEAIYNDSGGSVAGNSPFQTAWLPEEVRDRYLGQILQKAGPAKRDMVVFEGNAPTDIADNKVLNNYLKEGPKGDYRTGIWIWVGSPVAIKEPTAAVLRRQAGSNLLIVGQREDLAANMMISAMIGSAAQLGPDELRLLVLDGSPSGSGQSRLISRAGRILGSQCRSVGPRQVQEVISELNKICLERAEGDKTQERSILVLIYALQRYQILRRAEDVFGLTVDQGQGGSPDQQFRQLLGRTTLPRFDFSQSEDGATNTR